MCMFYKKKFRFFTRIEFTKSLCVWSLCMYDIYNDQTFKKCLYSINIFKNKFNREREREIGREVERIDKINSNKY